VRQTTALFRPRLRGRRAVQDVTSTSFGLIIAFLLPGTVALFSLSFWFASVGDAFHTFLTAESNVGLFLFLLLGALAFGFVVSAVRWCVYEILLGRSKRVYGPGPTAEQWKRLAESERFVAFRATIDETYRYREFFGGVTIAAPGLFAAWLSSLGEGTLTGWLLIVGFAHGMHKFTRVPNPCRVAGKIE
jgi:hypothetical protein